MIFNGLVGLLSRFKSAGSDDRNAVIEGSGVFGKTKSSYQMLSQKGVDGDILCSDKDFAVHVSESSAINSLINNIDSRLGAIRFLVTGEIGDLDIYQVQELMNEIDNQCERIDNEVNQHRKRTNRVHQRKWKEDDNTLHEKRIYDGYEIVE
jgi:hypothetical protein